MGIQCPVSCHDNSRRRALRLIMRKIRAPRMIQRHLTPYQPEHSTSVTLADLVLLQAIVVEGEGLLLNRHSNESSELNVANHVRYFLYLSSNHLL